MKPTHRQIVPGAVALARESSRRLLAAALLAALLASAGCSVKERRVGPVYPKVLNTRVEHRDAPVPDWPVWVFVNGRQVGALRTDLNGDVVLHFSPYVEEALAAGGLNLEFRFQQPDGKVEQRWYKLTADQLRAGTR